MTHGDLRRVLAGAQRPEGSRRITHPVLIVASWFDAQDFHGPFRMYRAMKEKNPGNKTHAGRRPVDARRLGARRRRDARPHQLRLEDRGALPRRHRAAVLQFPSEGQGPGQGTPYAGADGRLNLPGAVVFETGGNRWHDVDEWPPKNRASAQPATCRPNGRLSFTAPSDRTRAGVRRVRERSAQAGAVHRRDHDDRRARLHGRGSAVRRGPARRPGLRDRTARPRI